MEKEEDEEAIESQSEIDKHFLSSPVPLSLEMACQGELTGPTRKYETCLAR